MKAESSAIIEYNRLRKKYRPDLGQITGDTHKNENLFDTSFFMRKNIVQNFDMTVSEPKNAKKIKLIIRKIF